MIDTVTAVVARCDHRDNDRPCPSTLLIAVTDGTTRPTDQVARLAAMERGWGIADGERCPRHRTAAPAPDSATETAPAAT